MSIKVMDMELFSYIFKFSLLEQYCFDNLDFSERITKVCVFSPIGLLRFDHVMNK